MNRHRSRGMKASHSSEAYLLGSNAGGNQNRKVPVVENLDMGYSRMVRMCRVVSLLAIPSSFKEDSQAHVQIQDDKFLEEQRRRAYEV